MFMIQYEFHCHEFGAMHLILRLCISFMAMAALRSNHEIDSSTKNNNLK